MRGRILSSFEEAELEPDPQRRKSSLIFTIVGGGPTGVELAGTIVELAHHSLRRDFRQIDTRQARVVLIEAGPWLLAGFDARLSTYAQKWLERMGVEVILNQRVREVSRDGVAFDHGKLATKVVVWAAGVQASPAAGWVGAPTDGANRVRAKSDLTVPGHPEIFAIGDTASVDDRKRRPVPGIASAAKQQGRHVANTIGRRLRGSKRRRRFRYRHPGSLATVGKNAAVIDLGWIRLSGVVAWWWWLWGLVHIYYLIGTRHRFFVVLSWLWVYLTGDRSARLIAQPGKRQ